MRAGAIPLIFVPATRIPHPELAEVRDMILAHLDTLRHPYGTDRGRGTARTHHYSAGQLGAVEENLEEAFAKSSQHDGENNVSSNKNPLEQIGDGRARSVEGALGHMAQEALEQYFHTLNGHQPEELYDLVIGEVEKPLLRAVLRYTRGNQSLAATILGINRGTLRKKLRRHGLHD
jgi:Fis family transcriptional regulator, factor for inversion stimulation protein